MIFQAAAAAAASFNLICSGTLETTAFSGTATEPYRYEYRINLAERKWCDGECRALHDIAEIQPTALILEPNRDIDTPTRKEFFLGSINRETGRHAILSTSGRGSRILILKWEGTCQRAPFSGFPEFRTQF